MANHEHTENWSQPRPPGKRPPVRHGKTIRSEGAEIVDLGGLTKHLGYLIRRAQIWVFQDFIRTLATINIRPAQYSVLMVINANAGMTQMSLSKALGIERARLVHLLNDLEARKFVDRRGSKTDRRSHALHLTAKGRSALADIKALAQEHEKHLAERVGRKNHQLLLRLLACFASG
jgi:DNA-binding MarR family transcriptional regulator